MLDIGWQELLIIGVLVVVVMGPNELPRALKTVMHLVRKARAMASDFQRGIDDMVREAELEDIRKEVDKVGEADLEGTIGRAVDPEGALRRDVEEAKAALDDVPDLDSDAAPPLLEKETSPRAPDPPGTDRHDAGAALKEDEAPAPAFRPPG